ncbi:MAG: hypothetical protein PHY47_06955 [Lachnospiraceae bacterium]|nr:hypothetical protein [Lachnospiraceae bacterium]
MQINTNFVSWNYSKETTTSSTTNVSKPLETTYSKYMTKTNVPSVTDEYKKKHPSEASSVDSQVNAGKKVLSRNGVDNISRDSMSMDEYKKFFTDMMNSIPFDSSQRNDVQVWTISDKGWEQMKNDPDYEAWVLGYTVQDRSFHNPFASMNGYSPNYHTEQFGASIEEHLGQTVPMGTSDFNKSSSSKDEKSWWDIRHEKMQVLLEEQTQQAHKKAIAKRKSQQEKWLHEQIMATYTEM